VIRIHGKAAHASTPHRGDNAALKALALASEAFHEDWARELLAALGDPYGAGLDLAGDYPPMGYASVGLNILTLEAGRFHGETDIRFPAPLTAEGLTEETRRRLPTFAVRNVYAEPVVLHSPENPFVRTLLNNYRAHYPADDSPPYVSGGVTYAKVYAGRCAAYGPARPGDTTPVLAHQTDEYVPLDSLKELCDVYTDALRALSDCEG
jgi:succinyl-diaminopimelate desuccinylase